MSGLYFLGAGVAIVVFVVGVAAIFRFLLNKAEAKNDGQDN